MQASALDVRLAGCVLCSEPLVPFEAEVRRGLVLTYEICPRCGLVQMNPRPSEQALQDHYATEYRSAIADDTASVSAEAQRLRARNLRDFSGGVAPRRHLDVGCSTGTLLRTFGAPNQVGVEPGDDHRAMAAESGLEVHPSLEDLVAAGPEPFDLITVSHVLEHTPDPVQFLRILRELLGADGKLLVEVPNLYGHRSYEIAHLLAFAPESLAATLATAGFTVTDRRLHSVPNGGIGARKAISVLATASSPADPPAGPSPVRRVRARRWIGTSPQRLRRWAAHQRRRTRRHAKRLLRR